MNKTTKDHLSNQHGMKIEGDSKWLGPRFSVVKVWANFFA
jgi:hypothetical protein